MSQLKRYHYFFVFVTLCLLFYYFAFSSRRELIQRPSQTSRILQAKQKVILITKFYGLEYSHHWQDANKVCSNKCFFTTDMTAWNESAAIIIRGNYHQFLKKRLARTSPEQILIWLNMEPACSYQSVPKENEHVLFNWTFSYRRDSDIVAPYSRIFPVGKIPKQMQIINDFEYYTTQQLASNDIPSLKGFSNRKMAAWIVSNCRTWSKREHLVAEMKKTIPIDIYGFCGPHNCTNSRFKIKSFDECRLEIHQRYKFYLAFENSLCEDYVTEKFFDTLMLEMIPVVYGSVEYSRVFPPNSFINVFDYKSVTELTEYMTYVSENPQEWLKYFEWKKYYMVLHSAYLPAYCEVCDKLFSEEEKYPRGVPSKYYEDLSHWWRFNHTTNKLTCKTEQQVKQILNALQVNLPAKG